MGPSDRLALGALAALAFAVCWAAGERGFFPLDQSIVFDGAWRILCGQVPYRDFLLPTGPVVLWIQAAAFGTLGVSYASYLVPSAAMNAMGALLAGLVVRRLFPTWRGLDLLAGLVTAFWFYAPFGTPYFEQTAFLFGLAALAAALPALLADRPDGDAAVRLLAAGALAAVAILSKQNAGVLVSAALAVVVFFGSDADRRGVSFAWIAAGAAAVFSLFVAWLLLASDAAAAWGAAVAIPSARGAWRVLAHPLRAAGLVAGGVTANNMVAATAAFAAAARLRSGVREDPAPRIAALSVLALAALQPLFLVSAGNDPENGYPFVGILFAGAVGFGAELLGADLRYSGQPGARIPERTRVAWVVVLALLLAAGGLRVSLNRKVQNLFELATFAKPLEVSGLERLRWGEPTRVHGGRIRGRDVAGLIAFLRERREPFFVFPDFTMLYGIVAQPSPQPLLWFHRGLTYPERYDGALDRRIVAGLESAAVRLVVLERRSWLGTEERLDDFPELRLHLASHFRPTRRFGLFEVLERSD